MRKYKSLTKNQKALKRHLERKAYAIAGKDFRIQFVSSGPSIGFTSGDEPKTIYLKWQDECYNGLTDEEKDFFITGVFAHELLHQLYTDFDYTRLLLESYKTKTLKSVFMKFANTLEDPRIEHRAPEAYGGNLLAALRYVIRALYEQSPDISEAPTAFEQFIAALIDFGDLGFVKGEFTFDEAYETFVKVAPLYNKGINERSGKKALDIAAQCMELAKPLWEKEVKENEDMRKDLQDLMNQLMDSMGDTSPQANPSDDENGEGGSGTGEDGDESEGSVEKKLTPEEKRAEEIRKKTLEKIEEAAKRLAEKEKKASEEKSDDPENDFAKDKADKPEEANAKADEKSDEGSGNGSSDTDDDTESSGEGSGSDTGSDDSDDASYDSGSGEPDEDASDEDDADDSVSPVSSSNGSGQAAEDSDKSAENTDSDADGDTDDLTADEQHISFDGRRKDIDKDANISFDLTDEEKERLEGNFSDTARELALAVTELEQTLDNEREEMEREEKEAESSYELPELSEKLSDGRDAKIYNAKAGMDDDIFKEIYSSDVYNQVITENRGKINRFAKGLKEIFEAEKEEKLKTSSGKYNVIRGTVGTSARIFDRRHTPGNKSDTAVVVAIDCSGSMDCEGRYLAARESACIVGEALYKSNIPHYMFGYTSDIHGYDAYHVHYVTWDNWKSKKAHETLSEISPCADNFDGYSIEYAGELLKKAPQENKVLIVITDGVPACFAYRSVKEGMAHTKQEIDKVKKFASVCSIAIGYDVNGEELQSMYGSNFIHIKSTEDLSNMVIKRFLKTIEKM